MDTLPVWKQLTNAVSNKVEARWYTVRESDDLGNENIFLFLVFHVNPELTKEFENFMMAAINQCTSKTNWKIKQLKQEWRYSLMPLELDDCSNEYYEEHGVQVAKQAYLDLPLLKEAVEKCQFV